MIEALEIAMEGSDDSSKGHVTGSMQWKLNAQRGRRDQYIKWLSEVPATFVQRISEATFLVDDPKLQLETLTSIPGIGPATATVVLAFHDPTNYAVGERYMIAALFGEDRDMQFSDYPRLLTALRERTPGGFDFRTVETAYYRQIERYVRCRPVVKSVSYD